MESSRWGNRWGSDAAHRVLLWGLLAGGPLLACSGSSSPPEAPTSDGGQAAHAPPSNEPPPIGGSNYRFVPRQHHPHPATPPPPPPSLSSLAAFVDGSVECFGSATESLGKPSIQVDSTRGFKVGASGSAQVRLSASGKADLKAELTAKARLDLAGSASFSTSTQPGKVETSTASAPSGASKKSDAQPQNRGEETHVYLSNDDTMSLSSAQRLLYAIDEFAPISPEEIRPHEFLNYFTFETAPLKTDHDFSVLPRISPHPEDDGKWTLGLSVSGRTLSREERRNVNLAFVLDRSGSMSSEGRIEFVRRGLQQSLLQVKDGDVLHLTLFDSKVCQLAENFVVGRDSLHHLQYMVERISPTGSTDLDSGLRRGYEAADAAYRPQYSNRVILVTDALTNTGSTNEDLIALVGKHYDDRRIRLSGVGVGRDFNDSLLDELTERGKGAYVFLGRGEEVDRVMGKEFTSLVEPIGTNVHFILHLPPSLKMRTFYGEEASLAKEKVQAIHYFSGTSQMFLVDAESGEPRLPQTDDIMFTIEYTHPDSGQSRVEEYAYRLSDIAQPSPSLKKAQLVSLFARNLAKLAERPRPTGIGRSPETWKDPEAFQICLDVRARLEQLAQPLSGDDEAHKVRVLWDTYCRRYMQIDMSGPSSTGATSSPPGTRGQPSATPAPERPAQAPAAPPKDPGSQRNNDFAPD